MEDAYRENRKERRIRLTQVKALQRRFTEDSVWNLHKERPLGYWRKRGVQQHHCHKRKHGYPRVGVGLCHRHQGTRARIYTWRNEVRTLRLNLEFLDLKNLSREIEIMDQTERPLGGPVKDRKQQKSRSTHNSMTFRCPDSTRVKLGELAKKWEISMNAALVKILDEHRISPEEQLCHEAIIAARTVQTYLWGEANGQWGFEEWKRMLRKRIAKLDAIDQTNPHAAIEIRKRLLQQAALCIALMVIVEDHGVPWNPAPDAPPSNLPGHADPFYGDPT